MQIFRGLPSARHCVPCALTIGNFDGVHLGHQAMLHELKQQAKQRGLLSTVVTFTPHPREFFAPDSAPKRISTMRDKAARIAACGIDRLIILPFNAELADKTAESFIQDILCLRLQTQFILIGDDFKFGRKRLGDFNLLAAHAARLGYALQAMPPVLHAGVRVSSSRVRSALASGQMDFAASLLGTRYTISGHVIHGAKLGRTLGVPTLNVAFGHQRSAVAGIFVVLLYGLGACDTTEPLQGVANFGVRPALDASDVNQGRLLLETHCLEWPAHLGLEGGYGKIVQVALLHKLHDELIYDGLESLRRGIEQDIVLAKAYFQDHDYRLPRNA